MPGVVAQFIEDNSVERSREFGSTWQSNTVMPSGALGMAETRSQLVIRPHAESLGEYEVYVSRKAYLRENGVTVDIRERPPIGPVYGPFSREEAREFASNYIR